MTQLVEKSEIRLGNRIEGPADSSSYSLNRDRSGAMEPVTMSADTLRRHMCIFGRTGSGKSGTGMVVARELARTSGVSVLVLDRTGEFAHSSLASLTAARIYTPGTDLTISPFARRSDNRDDDLERSVSLMHHFVGSSLKGATFSPYQERALRDALGVCYGHESSRLSDVISELQAQGEKSRGVVKGWLEGNQAVISRLTPLASGSLARVFDVEGPGLSDSELFEPGLHVVNLGALDTDEARNMLSQVLCKLVISYGKKLGRTGNLRFVMMVDEAQHIAPNRWDYDGILEVYANELRKYGMGLVVIATRPTQVSENIIANSNTIISHSMTSGKDIDLVLNYMVSKLEQDTFIASLRELDIGECLIQLNDGKSAAPVTCKVDKPPDQAFQEVSKADTAEAVAILGHPRPIADAPTVPKDDSAWAIYRELPKWATDAAVSCAASGGFLRASYLKERGYSSKQIKQMTHGRHPILEIDSDRLRLTQLGVKIWRISKKPSSESGSR